MTTPPPSRRRQQSPSAIPTATTEVIILPGSYHVGCALPDGRHVLTDYRTPVVPAIQRVLERISDPDPKRNPRRGRYPGSERDLADKAAIAQWFDAHPETLCTTRSMLDGCHPATGTGPASTPATAAERG